MAEAEKRIGVARHEKTDVGEGFIWGTAGLVLGVLILCACLVLWLYPESRLDRTLSLPLPLYPAPRLQQDPAADMQHFHDLQMLHLNSQGWVDKSQGIVHIPISEAMRQIAHDGIPQWPATAQERR